MPPVHCGDQDKIQNSDFGQLRRNTAPEIIGAGFIHFHRYDVAGGQSFCALVNKQVAVDFGGVGLGAAGGDALGVLAHQRSHPCVGPVWPRVSPRKWPVPFP
jgi:hypothetical protein